MENAKAEVGKEKNITIIKKLIILGITAAVIIAVSLIGYNQYGYIKEAEFLRKVSVTLTEDYNAIVNFDEFNELPNVIEADKEATEAINKFNEITSSTKVDLNYAQLMLDLSIAIYNVGQATSEFVSDYSPKTKNQEIKDLFEDLKLANAKRNESARDVKEQSLVMMEYMKAGETILWDEGMKYLNEYQTNYDQRVDEYFDIKHKLENIEKRLVESIDETRLKLRKVEDKIIIN